MIRDMMVECVERRFGGSRAPHKVQWLTDNGSIFAAYKTIDIALALNLEPCFTPVESPESNGMAEAFVKTLQARLRPGEPNAAMPTAALAQIDRWMEDYNTVHPHSRLGYRSPREYITTNPNPPRVRSDRVNSTTCSGPPTWRSDRDVDVPGTDRIGHCCRRTVPISAQDLVDVVGTPPEHLGNVGSIGHQGRRSRCTRECRAS